MPRLHPHRSGPWLGALLTAVTLLPAEPTARRELLRALARSHRGVVFTQLPAGAPPQPPAGGMLRASCGEGARLVLLSPEGAMRVLSTGFHSASDPDVSFDGQRILFAAKKGAAENWNIYEMLADGTSVRQITSGMGNCRSPVYQSSLFVLDSDRPWYQATFVSDAAGEENEYGGAPSTNLYSVKLDGANLRRLTFNPSASLDPFQMGDGRILFASWQRHNLDRGPRGRVALSGVNLDGTDYALFAADEGLRVKHMPCVTSERLAVFVETDQAPWDGAGRLAAVSLRRNLHSHRVITAPADGLFHSPSALPDGAVLVSRRPADGAGTHGIYRLDPTTGRRELLFDDPGYHDIQAKLVAPRPEPDGRSSVVEEKDPDGKFYCLSVYTSDVRLPAGEAKRLRVLEGLPRRTGERRQMGLLPTRLLGEINLEQDGSFNIQTPANIPIQLQVLDAGGMALRSSAWIWVKNRESRGCIGCHEDRELTPENRLAQALTRPSIPLTLPPEKRRTVEYGRDVAPILAAKCATQACHGGGVSAFSKFIHPGQARTSPLVRSVLGSGKPMPPGGSPPLTPEEKRAIIEWIDLGAQP